ncbi:hypothetical protein JZ751_029078 [Albula glossodonta]|uniref:Uncharacterized protein n=1 Tax=Albula glossodonta TaxID=121402 RepID=A0A8T2PC16_9TELE|nr:hypothetical protein JZ751_029078 [Albula glossodonta]
MSNVPGTIIPQVSVLEGSLCQPRHSQLSFPLTDGPVPPPPRAGRGCRICLVSVFLFVLVRRHFRQ